jgi:hypothetical protein
MFEIHSQHLQPSQKRRGSGLPLNLFGSIRSKASSSYSSDQSSTSQARSAPSFIWRSSTADSSSKEGSAKEGKDDARTTKTMDEDDAITIKTMGSSKSRIRPSPLRQVNRRSEEYDWLEEQLCLERHSPTRLRGEEIGDIRRKSVSLQQQQSSQMHQRGGSEDSRRFPGMSSEPPSPMFPTSPTMPHTPGRQPSRGSERSRRCSDWNREPENLQVPVSPLDPQSASWRQSRASDDSRVPVSPMESQGRGWHRSQRSEDSRISQMRTGLSDVPEVPTWHHSRPSEDSLGYPRLEELQRLPMAPRPALFPPRTSSRQPALGETEDWRLQDRYKPQTSPRDPRSSVWEEKPLPTPRVDRKPVLKGILKPPPTSNRSRRKRFSGLPLAMFGSQSSSSPSTQSSL